jgi:glycine cleavage system protein P-like pyridoxal-binding family
MSEEQQLGKISIEDIMTEIQHAKTKQDLDKIYESLKDITLSEEDNKKIINLYNEKHNELRERRDRIGGKKRKSRRNRKSKKSRKNNKKSRKNNKKSRRRL